MKIPGSLHDFPECPAAFLRTASDVQELRERRGGDVFAEHLIDGVEHPAQMVSEWAFEVESGARSSDTLSPKAKSLVHLYLSEKASRDRFQAEERKEQRSGGGR